MALMRLNRHDQTMHGVVEVRLESGIKTSFGLPQNTELCPIPSKGKYPCVVEGTLSRTKIRTERHHGF